MLGMNSDIKVRLPSRLARALERAAQQKCTTVSEYTRQSLLARLQSDGVQIESDGGASQETLL